MPSKDLPVGFLLHQNSIPQFELWMELSDTLARQGTPSTTYFLFESVLLLELLKSPARPHQHLTACSLAVREQAVTVPEFVLPTGLPSLGRMIALCRPFQHFASHYDRQVTSCLDKTLPVGESRELHVAISESTHTHSALAEALRLVYGLNAQTDHRITLSLNPGQRIVLCEDPLTSERFRQLDEQDRILSNVPENVPKLIF